jgi:hypothetical protein
VRARRQRTILQRRGAAGEGPFYLFPDIGGNGHYWANKPLFWLSAQDACLQELGLPTARASLAWLPYLLLKRR